MHADKHEATIPYYFITAKTYSHLDTPCIHVLPNSMNKQQYIQARALGRSSYPNATILVTFPHLRAEVLWCPNWKNWIFFQGGSSEHIADIATATTMLMNLAITEELAEKLSKALYPAKHETYCSHRLTTHTPTQPTLA